LSLKDSSFVAYYFNYLKDWR